MKRQSIYVDPEELKKQNATDVVPQQAAVVQPLASEPLSQAPIQQMPSVQPQPADPIPVEESATQPPMPSLTNGIQQSSQATQPLPIAKKNYKPQKNPSTNNALGQSQQLVKPDESRKEPFGTKRQLQNDIQYTPAMKKHTGMQKTEAEEKVETIAARSDNLLMKLTTVFPFDFFPSTLTVDANKVSIVDKTFFASETVTTILLEEITDVVVQSSFFMAQLIITYSHHPLQPLTYKIPKLRKREALRAQDIIQGLLVLRISEGIDLSKLQPDEITKELAKIGGTHENLPAL